MTWQNTAQDATANGGFEQMWVETKGAKDASLHNRTAKTTAESELSIASGCQWLQR
jgi:hypothetical protein